LARIPAASALAMFACALGIAATPAEAGGLRPSQAESFPIGTSGSTCEAQGVSMGEARQSVFDRKWVILCSDVGLPVGSALALRDAPSMPNAAQERLAIARNEPVTCGESGGVQLDGGETARLTACRGTETGLVWNRYSVSSGGTRYSVEGLAAYDSALRLAMASIVADRIVPGEVSIVNLGTNDGLAIIKARAAVVDVDTLIGQGYRGNSAGAYAEAAELFASAPALMEAGDGTGENSPGRIHEITVNRALQLSNLGAFGQAFRLFDEARKLAGEDPVQTRLARNYEAVDAINRGQLDEALRILARAVAPEIPAMAQGGGTVRIGTYLAASLNSASDNSASTILGQETRLTPQERARIIDAQALQLRGTIERLRGDPATARATLVEAHNQALRVREGRVTSITRLRSQVLSEIALSYEMQGLYSSAEALLRRALALVESQYPESSSLNAAKARLAGFLARRGQDAEALGIFRSITDTVSRNRASLVGMENLMQPYFDLLAGDGQEDADRVSDLFLASQLVQRPGAADTLTQLSRQLEGGSGEASALFRQSLGLSREIERGRVRIARLNALAAAGGTPEGLDDLTQRQGRLLEAQLTVVNSLSAYPAYRAIANRSISVEELRATLKPGEAYLKIAQLSGAIYAVYISPTQAKGWRVSMDAQELTDAVALLRDSISVTINGIQSTYPFEIDAAVDLHDALLGPVADDIAGLQHLIFEPDGAMLTLPIGLLTGDKVGVDAYHARVDEGGDEFDFTGIGWLGRKVAVSTALSAKSFSDARDAPSSEAARSYMGLGQNVPLGDVSWAPTVRSVAQGGADAGCSWPASAWNQPIPAAELREASSAFGSGRAELITGAAFTDTAIMERKDLGAYRILHFATHGLVTAPEDGCPVRPALLTSFGAGESDGLLTFTEIFDLQLDADLIILSACDTAGQAGMQATREAGITSGGGQALDGLVRAFIAAGGRQVIASHWPAPEDYNATRRLFTSFYRDTNSSVGDALRTAQLALMDDPDTSHPFYWAGFAIIGDAEKPVAGN